MKQIDLDDLPPRIAQILASLGPDDEVVIVQGGGLIARLRVAEAPAPAAIDPPSDEGLAEVMEQFNALIHDEF